MNLEEKARRFVAQLGPSGAVELWRMSAAEARAASQGIKRTIELPPLSRIETLAIERDHAPPLPLRRYEPAGDAIATILYFHGGGWTVGSAEESDAFARTLASRTQSIVLSVDYQLAPEAPFPAAIEDGLDALRWCANASPQRTGVALPLYCMGDSAGGTIATVVTRLVTQDAALVAEFSPAGQILTCPVTDHRMSSGSYQMFAEGPLISRRLMTWFWDNYIPDPAQRSDPRASPLLAPDLTSMPRTFILTAENDVLRDEGEAYAAALERAGVAVTLKRYAGQIHGFVSLVGMFDGGAEALDDIARFVRGASLTGNEHG